MFGDAADLLTLQEKADLNVNLQSNRDYKAPPFY